MRSDSQLLISLFELANVGPLMEPESFREGRHTHTLLTGRPGQLKAQGPSRTCDESKEEEEEEGRPGRYGLGAEC